jgi:tetraacyldisaccharide 4'-kinase
MLARRAAYQTGVLRAQRLSVPVVIVGNLVVGGTGKTPVVLWLTEQLQRRGFRPGIVSRGYASTSQMPRRVPLGADAARFGDEPLLLAERSGVPVWIGHDRVAAARALVAAHADCDVLIADDGLQHYQLARDFEIAVEDERGFGNGLLLPAGPLRELPSRSVDAVIVNGGASRPGTFAMQLVPAGFYSVDDRPQAIEISALRGKRLHAVAGIGNPGRFFATLASLGLAVTAHPFSDHHPFSASDLDYAACDAILMTEKDAVKCRAFRRDDLYALRVTASIEPHVADLVAARLYGLQTT